MGGSGSSEGIGEWSLPCLGDGLTALLGRRSLVSSVFSGGSRGFDLLDLEILWSTVGDETEREGFAGRKCAAGVAAMLGRPCSTGEEVGDALERIGRCGDRLDCASCHSSEPSPSTSVETASSSERKGIESGEVVNSCSC